jgi:uncharacterized delta-60 repeat protein
VDVVERAEFQLGARPGCLRSRGSSRAVLALLFSFGLLVIFSFPAQAAPGDLDTSFGVGGLVRTDVTAKRDSVLGMAIQTDGKMVVVGMAGAAHSQFLVARYNPTDGALDSTFGAGGKLLTDVSPFQDVATSVAIQADGHIVVAGRAGGPDAKFAVVRYDTNGSLDTTFGGGDGIATINVSKHADGATGVGIQSSGRIVLAGGAAHDGINPDFAMVGLTSNGTLDPSFGSGGIVRTDFSGGSRDWGRAGLIVQPDDRIVVGGYTIRTLAPKDPLMAMARYTATGRLDMTFSGNGKLSLSVRRGFPDFFSPTPQSIFAMTLEGTSIVGVGQSTHSASGRTSIVAALFRVTATGSLDTTFHGDGTVLSYGYSVATGVAIDGSGNLVVVGRRGDMFEVARYHSNGTDDFRVSTDFGPFVDAPSSVAIQSDGKIVAAGEADFGSGNAKLALARYLSA